VAAGIPPTQSIHTDHLTEAVATDSKFKNIFFSNLEDAWKFGTKSSNLQSLVL
jgi:hypothetical protein